MFSWFTGYLTLVARARFPHYSSSPEWIDLERRRKFWRATRANTENSAMARDQHRKIAGDLILRITSGVQNEDGPLSMTMQRQYSFRQAGDIQVISPWFDKNNVLVLCG